MKTKVINCDRIISSSEVRPECMPEFISRFGLMNYFEEINNHRTFPNIPDGEVHTIPNNAMLVFPVGLRIAVKPVEELSYSLNFSFYDTFYDNPWIEVANPDIAEDVIRIMVNGVLAGYYYLKKNSFVLTDWTHNQSTLSAAQYVFTKLINDLNLKAISSAPTTKGYYICLGADPEFEVLDNANQIVAACDYLHRRHVSTSTRIGVDGCDKIAEFRPAPSPTPEGIIENISSLMKEFYDEYKTDLSVEGDTYAVGNHIHISISERPGTEPYVLRVTDGLINLFVDFLGRPFRSFNGLARGGYDALNAFRTNEHGFEYRALPAGVLSNPKTAYYAFKIARELVKTYLENVGRQIAYNNPPTMEDYNKIAGLTPDEYAEFVAIIRDGWRDDKHNIIGAWIGEDVKEKMKDVVDVFRPIIRFKDDWAPEIRECMEEILFARMTEHKITKPLVLFGVNRNRGNVCTIDVRTNRAELGSPGIIELGNFPQYLYDFQDGRNIPIGISFDIRHMEPVEIDLIDGLCHDIMQTVKEMCGGQ